MHRFMSSLYFINQVTESLLTQNEHLAASVVNCVGSSGQAPPPPPPPLKKEKQRPENWTKLEQQIFFNALRQVCSCED